jgi:hypothetical protein
MGRLTGLGAGTAAQGAQHFGGYFGGGAGEVGLGKFMVELGPVGFGLAVLFVLALTRYGWRILKLLRFQVPRIRYLYFGLVAWLATNVPVFMVASQAYGDPFVLLLISLSAGMVLAAPELLQRRALRAQQWAAARAAGPVVPMVAGIRR